jgi:hypothetical protein
MIAPRVADPIGCTAGPEGTEIVAHPGALGIAAWPVGGSRNRYRALRRAAERVGLVRVGRQMTIERSRESLFFPVCRYILVQHINSEKHRGIDLEDCM